MQARLVLAALILGFGPAAAAGDRYAGRTLVKMNEDGSFAVLDIARRPGTYLPQDRAEAGAAMKSGLRTQQAAPMLNGAYRDDEIVV